MTDQHVFPIPFRSLRTMRGGMTGRYVIGAMFTAAYFSKAERLAASCEKYGLPYELHEVPTVHRSMSVKGSDDLGFTKANFIYHLLGTHKKPVLYLDVDCEFAAQPHLISELVRSRCDFAIYNWLADEYADRFYPVSASGGDDPRKPYRYFKYKGGLDLHSTTQLIGAGLTQFYRNSVAARALLSRWHRTVAAFPGCGDDPCLNFTYNNLGKRDWLYWVLRKRWLPKAYARVMFWIYVEPVINHPDILSPNSAFSPFPGSCGRSEVYLSMVQRRDTQLLLPRDCIIDTQERALCKLRDGKLVSVGKTAQHFWI